MKHWIDALLSRWYQRPPSPCAAPGCAALCYGGQLHAASAADEYVKKLREKRKKHGK